MSQQNNTFLNICLPTTGASLWGPLKELWETVDGAVLRRQPESVHLLDLQLKKHKAHFLSLFRNPVRCCANTNTNTSSVMTAVLYLNSALTTSNSFSFSAKECRAEREGA